MPSAHGTEGQAQQASSQDQAQGEDWGTGRSPRRAEAARPRPHSPSFCLSPFPAPGADHGWSPRPAFPGPLAVTHRPCHHRAS